MLAGAPALSQLRCAASGRLRAARPCHRSPAATDAVKLAKLLEFNCCLGECFEGLLNRVRQQGQPCAASMTAAEASAETSIGAARQGPAGLCCSTV